MQEEARLAHESEIKRVGVEVSTIRAKKWVDAVIHIGKASDSALQKLKAAVHASLLAEHHLMKQADAIELEGRIRSVTGEMAATLAEQVRLEKSEELEEALSCDEACTCLLSTCGRVSWMV